MKFCRRCGTPIASDSPEGICPRCLLSVAMKDDPAVTVAPTDKQSTLDNPSAPAVAMIDIANAGEVAKRLPQHEILELLGRGGMGAVYKARQIQLDRIVALKILPPGDALSPGFVERFRREARSLAKLSHPNIVSVYDFGETNGLYYFVMEFVDGVNLREMIRSHRLTAVEALAVVPKICDALQFAHEEGVVHRDIKPENILLDKRGRVKIADFGLAKLLGREETDPRLTVSGAVLGTPRYMAPEQMEKPESVDHRADIYSLGVVFYEMLTGELPLGRFALPSEKVRVDVRLDEIVLHALERDVERRYQHASEVRADVENVTSKPAAAPTVSGTSPLAQAPPPVNAVAPTGILKDSGVIASLLATLAAAWLGVYVFDQHVQIGDAILLIASHLLFPIGAVAGVAWLIARRRPAAGGWPSLLRAHGPLLLGAHLLIFTAMMFGARLVENVYYNVGFGIPSLIYSEWAIDFWIGPFAVGVACVALILLLLTAVSARWAGWRGDIVLAAGVLIGSAVLLFGISKVHDEFTTTAAQHYKVTQTGTGIETVSTTSGVVVVRDDQNGLVLSLVPVLLLIVCGAVMVNYPGPDCTWPRLSRLALWGAAGPVGVLFVLIGVTVALRLEPGSLLVASIFGCPIAMTILGAIAVRQIKRSCGRLYGLRLAAVEAILCPLVLQLLLVGIGLFWLVLWLLTLVAPQQFQWPETQALSAKGALTTVLISLLPVLGITFLAGRALWRAIIGRPAAPQARAPDPSIPGAMP